MAIRPLSGLPRRSHWVNDDVRRWRRSIVSVSRPVTQQTPGRGASGSGGTPASGTASAMSQIASMDRSHLGQVVQDLLALLGEVGVVGLGIGKVLVLDRDLSESL